MTVEHGVVRVSLPVCWSFLASCKLFHCIVGLFYGAALWSEYGWYPLVDRETLPTLNRTGGRTADHPLDYFEDYAVGYNTIAITTPTHSLAEISDRLRKLLPIARRESQWGMIDALADALRTRAGVNPVL